MRTGEEREIRFLPDRIARAAFAAKSARVNIGPWKIDGFEALEALPGALAHGLTAQEFAAFLSREAEVDVDAPLQEAARGFLALLSQAGLLEVEERTLTGRAVYRRTPLARRLLKRRQFG